MKPIIFNGEMVRAVLDGRKTQTRRIIKPQPIESELCPVYICQDVASPSGYSWHSDMYGTNYLKCSYGEVGSTLWVKETWWDLGFWKKGKWFGRVAANVVGPEYVADGNPEGPVAESKRSSLLCKWRKRPSIHMPKWACRIWLEITGIRVERVQEISEEDATAEGVAYIEEYIENEEPDKMWFQELWDSINAKRGLWKDNPWVWVIEFKRTEP